MSGMTLRLYGQTLRICIKLFLILHPETNTFMKPIFQKTLVSGLLLLLLFNANPVSATSDTIFVQTFTFGSKQDSTFLFPKPGTYRKVLIYYTLKCNPKQSPACGQWDYLTYTYLFQKTGLMDSSVSKVDSTYDSIGKVYIKDTVWKKFEMINRFELGRYITPYGINLSLGNGFTWTYDVTDYLPLLHDSVHLSAGNWQELLDLKFAFITGTPARTPYKVINLWNGYINYGSPKTFGQILGPKTITVDKDAVFSKMLVRATGHGEDGSNCAEFCGKMHFLTVDGVQRWSQLVWRDNCAYSPLPAQGGTWLYQRANWCPGAEVQTYSAELTPYLTVNKSNTLVYDAEPYTTTSSSSGNSNPYYMLETQMVYYGKANFSLDAAVENILSPTTDNMFGHFNPVCANPKIIIKNNGTTTLTSVVITYGTKAGPQNNYTWHGKLAFLETDTVTLPQFFWEGIPGQLVFQARVSQPNGSADEYADDDIMYSNVPGTQKLPNQFILLIKTNNAASENAYTIKDIDGKIIRQRDNMKNSTIYRDTMNLPSGCYEFRFIDRNEDGLSFFANPNQGTGTLRIVNMTLGNIKTFNTDFGAEVLYNFNVGYGLDIKPDTYTEKVDVFPNPSSGILNIDATSLGQKPFRVEIFNLLGELVYQYAGQGSTDHVLQMDLTNRPAGVYSVIVSTADKSFSQKVVLTR
jgi:hypothetical protein